MIEVNGPAKKNFSARARLESSDSIHFRPTAQNGVGLLLASLMAGLLSACAAAATPRWTVAVLPSGAEFSLEIAADAATRQRGYMYRERVGPREGMLFVFDAVGHHSFWMKNCKVSLDIIWMDEAFGVVEIAHDRQPCPAKGACQSVVPMRSARYVLELAGGTAKKEGLRMGDRVVLLAEPSSN